MRPTAAVLLLAAAACGASDKWAEEKGDIPFVVGRAKGDAQAQASGRAPMYFFTATW